MLEISKPDNGLPDGHIPPVILFSEKVLSALTQQPGRIYESVPKDITPASSALESLEGLNKHKDLVSDLLGEALKKAAGSIGEVNPKVATEVVKKVIPPT